MITDVLKKYYYQGCDIVMDYFLKCHFYIEKTSGISRF